VSNCLLDRITSAKDAGVGSLSCPVPDCDMELESICSVLRAASACALFSPTLPVNEKDRNPMTKSASLKKQHLLTNRISQKGDTDQWHQILASYGSDIGTMLSESQELPTRTQKIRA